MLLQEERLFNGAWAHFMKSRELVFDRKLSFNGSSLSAFRLFMSVQERGGYKEVNRKVFQSLIVFSWMKTDNRSRLFDRNI